MCGSPFNDCESRWYHQVEFSGIGGKIIKVCPHCPKRGECESHKSITKYLGDVSIAARKGNSILLQEHHNIGKALVEWYGTSTVEQVVGLPDWDAIEDDGSWRSNVILHGDGDHNDWVRARLDNEYIPSYAILNARAALVKKGWIELDKMPEGLTKAGWLALYAYTVQQAKSQGKAACEAA